MELFDAIRTKRAIRKFSPTPLPDASVRTILNAGRRAQSSKNVQAWRFVAVQSRDTLEALSRCGPYAGHLDGAALGVVILTPDPMGKFQTMFDAGQAAAYMQLAGWALGIGSCPATLYEADRVREILGFPEEWHARIGLSFGYPAETADLKRAPSKGGRAKLSDIVHFERW